MLNIINAKDIAQVSPDTLFVPVCEDAEIHSFDSIVNFILKAREYPELKGDKDDSVTFYHPAEIPVNRLIFMGIGKFAELDAHVLRIFAGKAVKKAIESRLDKAAILVPAFSTINLDVETVLAAIGEGTMLANYLFDLYKTEKKQQILHEINLIADIGTELDFSTLAVRTEIICQGTALARNWVSTPASDKKPEHFAAVMSEMAVNEGLTAIVLNKKALKHENCNAILAVAAGSDSEPALLTLAYSADKTAPTVALVGKGVIFDSGGISMKPAASSYGMKIDMAGAAAVAGTLLSVARLKPKVNVVGVMPLVENMPSGSATRPGDIIKTYSGKTVEILNTDAEGRLILADAVAYAIEKFKPDVLIDIATLTGSCMMALGDHIAGLFCQDDDLAEALLASGRRTFERCWRLPLPNDYKKKYKSDIADIKNIGEDTWGGAIIGALFISEFIKDTKWAHLDIAGPAYKSKKDPLTVPGGTGYGVRLFLDFILNLKA